MNILNSNNNTQIIAYNHNIATNFDKPTVIFHHGFMSNMSGVKALYIENYCKINNLNFIRYDNYGCGDSGGEFIEQTLSTWLHAAESVTNQLTKNQQVIHVGSSLGAWLATLMAIKYPQNTAGVINIAAAFDFTENLIWKHLSKEQKQELSDHGVCYVQGGNKQCSNSYPITENFLTDARQYLLLNQDEIKINCPVHLIHGMVDLDVPYSISLEALHKINHNNVILKLIKDGDHRLSRISDLEIICHSINEIILK